MGRGRERENGRKRDRETERQSDRETERQRDREVKAKRRKVQRKIDNLDYSIEKIGIRVEQELINLIAL